MKRPGPGLLAYAAAAVVGLYAYTGPPFRLKCRGLGEPTIFLVFGLLLMTGAAYAQTGRLEPMALLLSVPAGLATMAILVGNNFRDRQEDAQAGIRTIGHFAGGKLARVTYLAMELAGVGALAGMAATGLAPRPLLAAPLTLALLVPAMKSIAAGRRMPDIDAHSARFEAVLLTLVLAAYLVWPVSP